MRKITYLAALLMFGILVTCVFAQDGEYEAVVTTESDNYPTVATVKDEEVVSVRSKDAGTIELKGAKIVNSEADGTNPEGKNIHIELNGYMEFPKVAEGLENTPYPINDEGIARVPDGGNRDVP